MKIYELAKIVPTMQKIIIDTISEKNYGRKTLFKGVMVDQANKDDEYGNARVTSIKTTEEYISTLIITVD